MALHIKEPDASNITGEHYVRPLTIIPNSNFFVMTAQRVLPFIVILLTTFFFTSVTAQNISGEDEAFTIHKNDADLEWLPCPEFLPDDCTMAVLQGDPAQPNADVFFRLPGNSEAPNHIHTSAERIVLITGEFHVDYEGQEPIEMTPGSYAYGPAELPHTAYCVSNEPCLLFIAFIETVDAIPVD